MRKRLGGLVLAVALVVTGYWCGVGTRVSEGEEAVINGPADLKGAYNITPSPYYAQKDYFTMKSTGSLVILSHFPTLQQSTEYSCGLAAALMVLKYFRPQAKATEKELCQVMSTSTLTGTTTKGMVKYFNRDKWLVESSLTQRSPETEEEFKKFVVEHLHRQMPIMVENIDWGGHWRVIIGYDDMGTETMADDVLIMADPYDTTDHLQDGYGIASAQRFFYMWFDAKLFPQNQRERPWLSVCPL